MSQAHFGPEHLRIPGAGNRLRGAADQLRDVSQLLANSADQLNSASADAGRGKATTALLAIAHRTGQILHYDSDQLGKLAEAVQAEGDEINHVHHGPVEDMRNRWVAARAEFIETVQQINQRLRKEHAVAQQAQGQHQPGGGQGNHGGERGVGLEVEPAEIVDPQILAQRIEANAASNHAQQISRLLDITPAPFEGGFGMIIVPGSETDVARSTYLHVIQQVLEEWSAAVNKIEQLDQAVEQQLRRSENTVVSQPAPDGDGQGAGDHEISAPASMSTLADLIAQGAHSINRAQGMISSVSGDLMSSRMQSTSERDSARNVFENSWINHLDQVHESTAGMRNRVGSLIQQLVRLDEQLAHTIRSESRIDN